MTRDSGKSPFWKDIHILETLRGGGIFFIIKILGSLGAYLFAWYVSKKYGAEGNGLLSFTLTAAVLLASTYNLGLNTYVVKIISAFRIQNNSGEANQFYRKALATVTAVTLAGSCLLLILSRIWPESELSGDLYLVSLMTIPVSLMLFISQTYRARKKILGHALLQNNVVQFGALIVLLFPFWPGEKFSEPVWAFIIAGWIMCFAGLVFSRIDLLGSKIPESKPFSTHIREALPMLAGGMAFILLSLSDRLMLRFLDTTAQLGIYDIALRLSNITLLGILSLNAIAEPKYAEFHVARDMARLRDFVKRTTWIGILISFPVIAVLGLFPQFWLGLFGDGDEFLTGTSSLLILLIGQMAMVGCGSVLILLNMTGFQRSVQTMLFATFMLNIALNAVLIPKWGIEGAAGATAFSTVLWNIWGVWTIRRKLGLWMWR